MARRGRPGLSSGAALAFQAGIGGLGVLVIWLAGIPVAWHGLGLPAQLVLGALGAGVTYLALLALTLVPGVFPDSLERQMQGLYDFASGYPRWVLVALSLLAGVGEELLFRGAVQGWLSLHLGPGPALLLASLLFGLVHFVSLAYCVVATGLGVVLGTAYLWSGSLGLVMAWHALYDLLALYCLLRFPHVFGVHRR
ncbi:CPBP family intramembrane glutamic endopeptidase [Marinobacter lutaoensis]|uniref:CPBP family intramembrane glutamic endopeptidase n=1 Tax=Marinobacter lutaoensis TaxID=135739 RepID=UPI00158E1C39|nr:CPBP family intramembrane glutamic endopeptidase [Marinobacter lutaoensis]NVD34557.1 CPBP family intramembrane metalloprotease [Marinobacter lutaoensis]